MTGYAYISKVLALLFMQYKIQRIGHFINIQICDGKYLRWSIDKEPSNEIPIFFDDIDELLNIFLPSDNIPIQDKTPVYKIGILNMAMIPTDLLPHIILIGKIPKNLIAKLPLYDNEVIAGQIVTKDFELIIYPIHIEDELLQAIIDYQ